MNNTSWVAPKAGNTLDEISEKILACGDRYEAEYAMKNLNKLAEFHTWAHKTNLIIKDQNLFLTEYDYIRIQVLS